MKAAPDVILVMTKGLQSVGGVDGLEKVPGVAQACRTRRPVRSNGPRMLRGSAPAGPSWGRASQTAAPVRAESVPAPTKVTVQPALCSRCANGMVATMFPAEPSIEVTATMPGKCRGEKWCDANRSTLTKVSASPQPRTPRASRASE